MDTDERFLAPTDYKKALNCRIAKSDEGNDGIIENIRSNKRIVNTDFGILNAKVIGSHEDLDNGVVIYFVAGDNTNAIYRFDPKDESIQTVYKSNLLNFNKDYLITGVNVVGSDEEHFPLGLLYWTDDLNPPRTLNIKKAIDFTNGTGGYSSIDTQTLDAVKYPPWHPPRLQGTGSLGVPGYLTDKGVLTNQLIEKSFQFKYRWIYDDLEKSAWSAISKTLTDVGFNRYYDLAGNESSDNNVISIKFNTGHQTVKRIQIAARNTNGTDDFILIADIDKENVTEYVVDTAPALTYNSTTDFGSTIILEDTLIDNSERYFLFYNDGIYSTIDVVESDKLYDDVPHLAKAQEVVDGNRMVYGNVVSGQNGVHTDVTLEPVVVEDPLLTQNIQNFTLDARHRVSGKWGNHDYSGQMETSVFRLEYEFEIIFPSSIVLPPGSISVFKIEVRNWQLLYSLVTCNTGAFNWGNIDYPLTDGDRTNMWIYNIDYTHATTKTNLDDIRQDIADELSQRYNDPNDNTVRRYRLFGNSGEGYGLIHPNAASNGQTQPFQKYENQSGNAPSNPLLDVVGHSFHTDFVDIDFFNMLHAQPGTYGAHYLHRIGDGNSGPYGIQLQDNNDHFDQFGNWYAGQYNQNFRDRWHPLNEVSCVNWYSSQDQFDLGGNTVDSSIGVQVSAGQKYDAANMPAPTDTVCPGIIGPSAQATMPLYDNAWSNGADHKSFWTLRTASPAGFPLTCGGGTYSHAQLSSISPSDVDSVWMWVSRGRLGDFPNDFGNVNAQGDTDWPGSYHNLVSWPNMCLEDKQAISELYNSSYIPIHLGVENIEPTAAAAVAVAGTFKAGSNHRFGLVYYDRANRSSSVQLGRKSTVYIPRVSQSTPLYDNINYDTGVSASAFNSTGYFGEWNIQWNINHIPPVWATHYQWVYGGNALTDNFLHFVTDGIYDGLSGNFLGFSEKTDNNGAIIPDLDAYKDTILVDITNIRKHNRGEGSGRVFNYNWIEGDVLRFITDQGDQPAINNDWEFKVLGIAGEREFPRLIQSGENISTGVTNSGLDDKDFLVLSREAAMTTGPNALSTATATPSYVNWTLEIYSPKGKVQEDKAIYYEVGEVGEIGNPYQDTRFHRRIDPTYQNQDPSTSLPATGVFKRGDIFLRYRNSYSNKSLTLVEGFHSNDKFLSNYWDKGRPNAVLEDFRRNRKHSTCLYSDPYIPNTNINGISSIYPDVNFAEFERSYNSIQKLYSKDNRLIIFQEDKVSQSLVKRDVIYNVDGSGNVATSDNVLSQAVPYLGKYGVNKNPESFAYNGNRMYFVDVKRGAVLRLSQDGFTEISNNKMREFFTDKATSINNALIDGNRFNVYGVYDIRFNEYIVAFEKIDICPGGSTGPSWDCVNGVCVKYCDNSGAFSSASDCYTNCGATGAGTSNLLPSLNVLSSSESRYSENNPLTIASEDTVSVTTTTSSTSSTSSTSDTSTETSVGRTSSGY